MSSGERIRLAMEAAGITSAADLARRTRLNDVTVRAYLRDERALSTYAPAAKLARELNVSPEYLLGQTSDPTRKASTPDPTVTYVPVRGVAQAGTWKEYEEFDYSEMPPVSVVQGQYLAKDQFAWAMRGDSLDKIGVNDGDFVICVPYWIARLGPTDGDLVAVERRSGPKIERTVKRLRLIDGNFELHPESTNPIHKVIKVERNTGLHDGEGAEVEIVGLAFAKQGRL